MKLIFITGSLSGLGKGTIAASISAILKFYGINVSIAKIDPYMNVDAGLMNPHEHGEVFVLNDVWKFQPVPEGPTYYISEVDQDFGTYERFLHENIKPYHSITSGQIFLSVILKERAGKFLGKTVQLIPHVVEEIKNRILTIAREYSVTIVEIGGTVGDYEASIYLEAIRQLRNELESHQTMLIHVVWVPYLETVGEFKTKPAQQSFRLLLESGLLSDAIIARIDRGSLTNDARHKLSLYSNVPIDAIFEAPDIDNIYELPLLLMRQGIHDIIFKRLMFPSNPNITDFYRKWQQYIERSKTYKESVNIALIGKYMKIKDSYRSIIEALNHAGIWLGVKPRIISIEAEEFNLSKLKTSNVDGIILTPGFGKRGTEEMIAAAEVALRFKIPTLGICFGAQLATVAFARYYMGWTRANSTEIDPNTPHPVVDLLPNQRNITHFGGTMRLGGNKIIIKEGTCLEKIYGKSIATERFRHRYHIVIHYAEKMSEKGYRISAVDNKGNIAAFEIVWHPFFIGVQYHPEYTSRPLAPHPLFKAFLEASLGKSCRS